MAGKIPVPNFDPARIPQTTDEVNFHADATYVFERMAADIIPDFNHNLDWFEAALTGDLTSLVDSMTAYKAALTTLGHRNKIMNGQFNIDQRGSGGSGYTSTGGAFFTFDRWRFGSFGGSTSTVKQGSFTLGQTDVPNNPEHYLEWERSVAGTSNAAFLFQRIEGVETLSGKTATRTFWAKSSAATELRFRLTQFFGSGGTPSSSVVVLNQELSLTTSWQKFTVSFVIPSVSGKTLGTNGDDYVEFAFDRDFDDTNPTATVSIANISLVEGDATAEEDPGAWRNETIELLMCQDYTRAIDLGFVTSGDGTYTNIGSIASYPIAIYFPDMRVPPDVDLSGVTFRTAGNSGGSSTNRTGAAANVTRNQIRLGVTSTGLGETIVFCGGLLLLDAEL